MLAAICPRESSRSNDAQQRIDRGVLGLCNYDLRGLHLDKKSSDVTILVDNVEFPAHSNVLAKRCLFSYNRYDLYLDEKSSDVTIIVDNVEIPAHSNVLAQRCQYFKAMFASGMIESTSKRVEIQETSIEAFKPVLKWIYTGTIELKSIDEALKVLRLANMYELRELQNLGSDFMKDNCTFDNVCSILNEAVLLSLKHLTDFTIEFVNKKRCKILKHEMFEHLSKNALNEILTRVVFPDQDIDVFRAVVGWMKAHPSQSAGFTDILENVVLNSITDQDKKALPSDVCDAVNHLIRENKTSGPTYCFNDENIAVPRYGVKFIASDVKSSENNNLINRGYQIMHHMFCLSHFVLRIMFTDISRSIEDCTMRTLNVSPFFDTGILKHVIGSSEEGILIDLGHRFKLNLFKMLLVDAKNRTFSYYIDVSEDKVNWTRVIDYSKYPCGSLQNLYFKPRPVRYIRICGTAPINDIFGICRFKALYTTEPLKFDTDTGLHIPVVNKAMFLPKMVCTQVCKGSFEELPEIPALRYVYLIGTIIQLAQPFFFESIRLMFVEGDIPAHMYNIDVSADGNSWTRVFSNKNSDIWHTIQVNQPAMFFKYTGMHDSKYGHYRSVMWKYNVAPDDE
uniref:BTB domain-containing protein n=1 Tax=Panagrellus redivivus TaxID=6233 RepID=A0A7E4W815_PANRE